MGRRGFLCGALSPYRCDKGPRDSSRAGNEGGAECLVNCSLAGIAREGMPMWEVERGACGLLAGGFYGEVNPAKQVS